MGILELGRGLRFTRLTAGAAGTGSSCARKPLYKWWGTSPGRLLAAAPVVGALGGFLAAPTAAHRPAPSTSAGASRPDLPGGRARRSLFLPVLALLLGALVLLSAAPAKAQSNVRVSAVTATSVTVAWVEVGTNSWLVQWKSGSQDWSTDRQAQHFGSGRTYEITGLSPSTEYSVRLQRQTIGAPWSSAATGKTLAAVSSIATTSTPGAGDTYGAGENIFVTVTFSEAVTVAKVANANPTVGLVVGSATETMGYVSGSGTAKLKFAYRVASTDTDTDGVSLAENALSAAGSIKDSANNDADRATAAVSAQSGHKVDGSKVTPLTVSSIAITSSTRFINLDVGWYSADRFSVIQATVTFNRDIAVTGTPQLTLKVGTVGKTATCAAHGSDTKKLVCSYTVATGDEDTDGVSIDANSLKLPTGASIKVSGGTLDAVLTHDALPAQSGHKVDGIRPVKPSNFRAAPGDKQATLTWDALDDANLRRCSYQYKVAGGSFNNWSTIPGGATVTSHTVGGLANGVAHTFHIRCSDNALNVGPRSDVTVTPKAVPPPLVPTGFNATASGQTQIDLSWTAPAASTARAATTGYEVQWSANGRSGWTALTTITSAATTTHSHTGLIAGTTRFYRVRATSASSANAPWSGVKSATTATTGLTATASGQTRIDLSWTGPETSSTPAATTGYEVEVSPSGTGNWAALTTITAAATTTHAHTGLAAGTTRHYRVRATSASGAGAWSRVASATTVLPAGALGPPARQSVEPGWSLIPKDAGNEPLFTDGQSFRLLFVTSTLRNAESTDIADYNTFVQARAAAASTANAGIRSFSGQFRALISTATVDARDNTATTGAGVPVYWLGGAKVADNYADLYDGSWDSRAGRTETGGSYGSFVWTGSNADGTEFPCQQTATVCIFRYGSLGAAQSPISQDVVGGDATLPLYALSPVITVGDTTRPEKPAGFTASGGNRQVALSWTDPSDATITGWQVRHKAGTGTYGRWTDIDGSGAATVSHIVTNLTIGTQYTFQVRAVDAGGAGTASDEAAATPTEAPVPLAPTGLTATAFGQTRIDLSWTAPAAQAPRPAPTGYEVEWSANGTSGWTALTTVTGAATTTYRDTGLGAGTTRHYRVRATSDAGAGAWSSAASATTAAAPVPPAAQRVPDDSPLVPDRIGVGQSFRLLFVTSTQRGVASPDIAVYNAFVQARAAAGTGANARINRFSGGFRALISTVDVDARVNTATTGAGVPVYWLGGAKVADDYPDLYDGSWDSGAGRTETGGRYTGQVVTGSNADGTKHAQNPAGASAVEVGTLGARARPLTRGLSGQATTLRRFYALSPVLTVADNTRPAAPAGLAAAPGNGQVTLSWSPPRPRDATITGYAVSVDGGDWAPMAGSGPATVSHAVTDLAGGQRYRFRIRARDAVGPGAASLGVPATVPRSGPGRVTGLRVEPETPPRAGLAVTWDPVPGASGYKVQWKTGGDAFGARRQHVVGQGNTRGGRLYVHLAGHPGETVTVRVVVTWASQPDGRPSAEVTATVPDVAAPRPDAKPEVTVVAGVRALTLSWDGLAGATHYRVRWWPAGGAESGAKTATAEERFRHTIAELTAGTAYHVRVRAVYGSAEPPVDGAWSQVKSGTPLARAPVRPQVTELTVEPGPGTLTLTWPQVPGVHWYKVQWKSGGEGYDPEKRQQITRQGNTRGGKMQMVLSGRSEVTYTVRVIAVADESLRVDGPPSEPVTATPLHPGAPRPGAQPPQVTVTPGHARLTVSWDPLEGATDYEVRWWPETAEESGATEVEADDSFRHTLEGLEPEVAHTVRVRAVYGSLEKPVKSAWSEPVSATPLVPPEVSVANAQAPERSMMGFVVTLVPVSDEPVFVDWLTLDDTARGGADYRAARGTLEFAPGEREKSVSVEVLGDAEDEEPETVTLLLTNPRGAVLRVERATGTITNGPASSGPALSAADAEAVEGETLEFAVRLSEAAPGPVTVEWRVRAETARAGSDFRSARGTLTFAPGEREQTAAVSLREDMLVEGAETVRLVLANPTGAALADAEAVGTIVDVGGPGTTVKPKVASVSVTGAPGADGWAAGARIEAVVRFDAPVLAYVKGGRPTLALAVGGNRRAAPFVRGSGTTALTFIYTLTAADAGASRARVVSNGIALNGGKIRALGRRGAEAALGYSVAPWVTGVAVAPEPGGDGRWSAPERIEVRVAFSEAVTVETGQGTPTLALLADGAAREAAWAAGSGTATLVFAYETAATDGTVRTAQVPAGTLALEGATVRGATGLDAELAHEGAVLEGPPPPPPPAVSVADAQGPEGAALAFAVTLDRAASGPVTVEFATADGTATAGADYEAASGTLAFAAGETAKTVTVATLADTAEEETETLTLTLSNPSGATLADAQAAGSITDVAPAPPPPPEALTAAFTEAPSEHGGKARAFTVRIAFSAPVTVGATKAVREGTVQAGNARIVRSTRVERRKDLWEFRIKPRTHGDVTVTLAAPADCTAAGAVCTADGRKLSSALSLTVAGPALLSVADARAKEGEDATIDFAVTLSRAASGPVTVDYATKDGTAKAGEDYEAASGTLSFAVGETEKTVSVTVLDDAHDEGEERFTLKLSNPTGARIGDAKAVGVIENSDAMPKAWLARFGRTVTGQVLDMVAARLEAPRSAGAEASLAGQALPSWTGTGGDAAASDDAAPDADGRAGLAAMGAWLAQAGPDGRGTAGFGAERDGSLHEETRALTGRDFLTGTSFALTGGTAQDGGGWASLWGRGAIASFDGREGALTLDGEVVTGMLGADWATERWTVSARTLSDGAVFGLFDGDRLRVAARPGGGAARPSARQAASRLLRCATALRVTRRRPRDTVLPWP